MKTEELRALDEEALQKQIIDFRKSSYGLRVQLATQQHQKTSETKRMRRLIARAKTILAEKQKEQSKVNTTEE